MCLIEHLLGVSPQNTHFHTSHPQIHAQLCLLTEILYNPSVITFNYNYFDDGCFSPLCSIEGSVHWDTAVTILFGWPNPKSSFFLHVLGGSGSFSDSFYFKSP